jgi:hypothetical protein
MTRSARQFSLTSEKVEKRASGFTKPVQWKCFRIHEQNIKGRGTSRVEYEGKKQKGLWTSDPQIPPEKTEN